MVAEKTDGPLAVPCGPVRTIDETLADAQLAARGMIERLVRATAYSVLKQIRLTDADIDWWRPSRVV